MELKHQLIPHLKQLRLSGILETLEARHRQALDGKWSYMVSLGCAESGQNGARSIWRGCAIGWMRIRGRRQVPPMP